MRLHHSTRYLVALLAAGVPALAQAQGYGLNEIGSCAVARGSANTSAPCADAAMIFWNPAALTSLKGSSGLIGISGIGVKGDFTQDTTLRRYSSEIPWEYPPSVFWGHHNTASKWAFGIGAYVPYGLTSQWPDTFPGRFSALKASVQTIYGQPTIAYQLTQNWSVGVGAIIAHSSLELNQALDLSAVQAAPGVTFGQLGITRGTEFGRVNAKGNAWGGGFTAAIQGKLSPNWQAGARFLSQVKFNYSGDAKFTQTNTGLVFAGPIPPSIPAGTQVDTLVGKQFQTGGALVPQGIETKLTHPAQVQAGVTYTGFKNTGISVEYEWIGWSAFKNLPVTFTGAASGNSRSLIEDYNNSSVLRVGADHRLTRAGMGNGWNLRGGFSVASSAAPPETVTPLLPEQDRYTLNAGVGLPLTGRWALDASYAYVGTWGARGRIGERTSTSQTAEQLNTGWYRLHANILSLAIKATY